MIVEFEGEEFEFPDDATDEEITNALAPPPPKKDEIEPGLYALGNKLVLVNEDGSQEDVQSESITWLN